MNLQEIFAVGGGFVVIGGGIAAVVRWLDKGKLISEIDKLKKDLLELSEKIKELQKEWKDNSEKDQLLREKVIAMESADNSMTDTMSEMKEMLKTVLFKLEERHEDINSIKSKIAVLEQKIA